jgi:hypothetical protein
MFFQRRPPHHTPVRRECAPDLLERDPQLPVKQDLLQPVDLRLSVYTIAVRADTSRREETELIVIPKVLALTPANLASFFTLYSMPLTPETKDKPLRNVNVKGFYCRKRYVGHLFRQ